MNHLMTHPLPRAWMLVLLVAAGPVAAAWAAPPKQLTPHLPFDDVRIGMKGYGLTVFAGTTIEPFPVEVVAVVPNDTPQHGTIWIVCDDPRLEQSGPVQGMSGSPIYLWDDQAEHTLGEGGKLIGAFAFGYGQVEICLAGVQPIEYMRSVATRAVAAGQDDVGDDARAERGLPPRAAMQTLARLNRSARIAGATDADRFRIDLATRIMHGLSPADALHTAAADAHQTPADPGMGGRPMQLSLPLAVGSPADAAAMVPLFEASGIVPVAGAPTIAGKPPVNVDADIALEPGGVLAVPLAFGDADLAATGTVTEVLPDGTVIGFGHPMFGDGGAAMPMATGYVHFVVPRNSISFKRAASLKLVGSIVRDESAAVAGIDKQTFKTVATTIAVSQPDIEARTYKYQVLQHHSLLPALVGTVLVGSASAVHAPNHETTQRATGHIVFEGGRKIPFNTAVASAYPQAALTDLGPAITVATQNPFGIIGIESIDIDIDITDGADMVSVEAAHTTGKPLRPGDTAKVSVKLRPYKQEPYDRVVAVPIPLDLPPGEYNMMIGGAPSYTNRLYGAKPYLFHADNKTELLDVIEHMMRPDRQSLYIMLQTNRQALAIGRRNLDGIPASRAAMLANAGGVEATTFQPTLDQVIPIGSVVQGEVGVTLTVLPPE